MHITLVKDGQTQVLDSVNDAEKISQLKAQGWKEKTESQPVTPAAKGEEQKR